MHFEKVSLKEWKHALKMVFGWDDGLAEEAYDKIQLPKRSSINSAGYDFFLPFGWEFGRHPGPMFPLGVRWVGEPHQVLLLMPRSGLGTKYGFRLCNTIGVIDADYCNSDNEGHILMRAVADQNLLIEGGKAVIQGIVVNYAIASDDVTTDTRNGGFGSSDKA